MTLKTQTLAELMAKPLPPYDCDHEAKACVNELLYRFGPKPRSIHPSERDELKWTIQEYLQEAYKAGRDER